MPLVRWPVVLAVVGWLATSADGATGSRAPLVRDLQEAAAAFDRGVRTTDHTQAVAHFRVAARKYEHLVKRGVQNGGLHYNLGNTYFWLGDLGRAIIHYRRAERLAPAMPKLRSNLAYARGRVVGRVEKTETRTVLESVLLWHYEWSARTRSIVATVAYVLAWTALLVRLFWRRRALTALAVCGWIVTAALAGSIVVERRSQVRYPAGVVLADKVQARKGSGQTFAPAFDRPLHAGTEFAVSERRGVWWEIELPNGQTGWIPAEAGELVDQPPSGYMSLRDCGT